MAISWAFECQLRLKHINILKYSRLEEILNSHLPAKIKQVPVNESAVFYNKALYQKFSETEIMKILSILHHLFDGKICHRDN